MLLMPDENREALQHLLLFLYEVAEQSDINKVRPSLWTDQITIITSNTIWQGYVRGHSYVKLNGIHFQINKENKSHISKHDKYSRFPIAKAKLLPFQDYVTQPLWSTHTTKAVADSPVGQVLARPLFPKVKTKFHFIKSMQIINKSTRVIFVLIQLIILWYNR